MYSDIKDSYYKYINITIILLRVSISYILLKLANQANAWKLTGFTLLRSQKKPQETPKKHQLKYFSLTNN